MFEIPLFFLVYTEDSTLCVQNMGHKKCYFYSIKRKQTSKNDGKGAKNGYENDE